MINGKGKEEEEGEPRLRLRRVFREKSLEKTLVFVTSRTMHEFVVN